MELLPAIRLGHDPTRRSSTMHSVWLSTAHPCHTRSTGTVHGTSQNRTAQRYDSVVSKLRPGTPYM
eukprot:752308-Rhodomonas_salina.2